MKRAVIAIAAFAVPAWLAWTAAGRREAPAARPTPVPTAHAIGKGATESDEGATVAGSGPVVAMDARPAVASRAEAGSPDGPGRLVMPVAGVDIAALHSNFDESRGGGRRHEALDIAAPRGTEVRATADGSVRKIFTSRAGGLTVYQFDPSETWCFYYAHLDRYAPGLTEGQALRTGDLIGYVGTTGNAPPGAPHLHFAVIRLDADRRWWGGTPVDPYPLLAGSRGVARDDS